jgi:hypothetical protein
MSGYSSDGVLSISDSISAKDRNQSPLLWSDEEKNQPAGSDVYAARYGFAEDQDSENVTNIALQSTTSPFCRID